jgi:tetratricopeptide (TPR) repeat protein
MGVLGTTNSNTPDNKNRGLSGATNGSNRPPAGGADMSGAGPTGGGTGMPVGPAQGGPAGGGGASGPNGPGGPAGAGLSITGGAAIMAPVNAFPGGIPTNALIVLPLSAPTDELKAQLDKGPVALTPEQMWKLLGFNGPAVQVQDDQGRPIAIGLEDLIAGLQKHWDEAPDDLNRGRILAQELLKYGKLEKAEAVLSRVVAKGGQGDDWLALGVAQLQQKKFERAEGTLRGAQNLMPENPYPSLHLAKIAQSKGEKENERTMAQRAISIDANCVDAWAYYFQLVRDAESEDKAIAAVEELASASVNQKSVAPYVAIQGFYSNEEATRDKAVSWAKKAVARNADDPLAILCLSALYGAQGNLDLVISTLQPHEGKMARDVRLANNYFEALFQSRQIDKVTKLLNALAGSPNRDVKQFAIERSRMVAQFLQQQQAQLAQASQRKP